VNPLQPNAEFEVKISANWVPTWAFWTAVVGGVATVLICVCAFAGRLWQNKKERESLASLDNNKADISRIESEREPVEFGSVRGKSSSRDSGPPRLPVEFKNEPLSAI
jgi:hypothetical protein